MKPPAFQPSPAFRFHTEHCPPPSSTSPSPRSMPGPAGTFPDHASMGIEPPLLLMPGCLSGGRVQGLWKRFCSGCLPFLEGGDMLVSNLLAKGMNGLGPHNTTGL